MDWDFEKIFTELEFLLSHYSTEYRTSINPWFYNDYCGNTDGYKYEPTDIKVRERLSEHVGILPIVATYLHQYLQSPVNLGRSLEMLAIHDIGELLTSDENFFTKSKQSEDLESTHALGLLNEQQSNVYLEFQAQVSNEAKYAMSIDKLVANLFDLWCDTELTTQRVQHYIGVDLPEYIDLIKEKKPAYMKWDGFLTQFHRELLKRLDQLLDVQGLD